MYICSICYKYDSCEYIYTLREWQYTDSRWKANKPSLYHCTIHVNVKFFKYLRKTLLSQHLSFGYPTVNL